MKEVLVPIDDSEESTKALEWALDNNPDADITVLHVIDEHIVDEEDREKATKLLKQAEATADSRDRMIESTTVTGNADSSIIDYTKENNFDQIIMGSHGRTGGTRVLFGSIAESVVRQSPVPVTIVR